MILIHGDNNLASFKALQQLTDPYDELSLTKLDGVGLDLTTIQEALETPSFSGRRLVLIEDLSRNRSQSLLAELKKYLASGTFDQELVIYERKLLPPESPLLDLSKEVKTFAAPSGQSVFDWTDQVGKRDLGAALSGWNRLLELDQEPEYLFLMLVRQFRLLLLLKLGYSPNVRDFVRGKLSTQLRFWSERDLRAVYHKLWQIDRDHKNGTTPLEISVPGLLSLIGRVEKV